MSVHVLRCPNCGADLDVVDGVETIRCKFCGARCHVEGHGAGQHLKLITAQLDRLEGHASRTAAEIEALRMQQERAWASQAETDDALRRAATVQEIAAHETAYAARLQSATHEAFIHAGQQVAAEQEAERRFLLSLRARYRVWRVLQWIGAFGMFFVTLFVGAILNMVLVPDEKQAVAFMGVIAGAVIASMVTEKVAKAIWVSAGRKYNERAFLFGLPEVRVKSKAEAQWDKEASRLDKQWKKASRNPSGSNALGWLVLLALVIWGISALASGDKGKGPAESKPANNGSVTPSDNTAEESGDGQNAAPEEGEPQPANEPKTD